MEPINSKHLEPLSCRDTLNAQNNTLKYLYWTRTNSMFSIQGLSNALMP